MNLCELRTEFVKKSGRYDLVDESFADDGADFFIQAGQRLLDRFGDFGSGQIGEWQTLLQPNAVEFIVRNCWSISSIYSRPDTSSVWYKLTHTYSFETPKCLLSNEQMYTLVPIASFPKLKDAPASSISLPASALSHSSDFPETQAIRVKLLPAVHQKTLIRVVGHFHSEPLLLDSDTNFWSQRWPETLLKAAMYELEVFYRNSEGAKDWYEAILVDMHNLEQTELFASIQGDLTMGD